jgi:hypothetical protein
MLSGVYIFPIAFFLKTTIAIKLSIMKRIILAAALFISALTQAQVITATGNDETITEGKIFTFNTLDVDTATLVFHATNVSANTIDLRLKCEEITNSDGTDVQFCYGQSCYTEISTTGASSIVPPNSQAAEFTLDPQESTSGVEHFWNANPGTDPTQPVLFKLSFVTMDHGTLDQTLLTFYYKYDATAGVNDFTALKNIGLAVTNTAVKNAMEVTASQNAKLNLYGVNGQLVKTAAITSGTQSVDLSGVATGVYIARFTTQDNRTAQIRIAKN